MKKSPLRKFLISNTVVITFKTLLLPLLKYTSKFISRNKIIEAIVSSLRQAACLSSNTSIFYASAESRPSFPALISDVHVIWTQKHSIQMFHRQLALGIYIGLTRKEKCL